MFGTTSNHTGMISHTAGHWPTLSRDCETCDQLYLDAQRKIFAAARLVRDSQQLQGESERALFALAFIGNYGERWADGADFDNRYAGVWPSFREYSDDYVDECVLIDSKPESTLARYFDYEAFARDLGYETDVVDLPDGRVLIFSQ